MSDPSAGSGVAASRARWPVTDSFDRYASTSPTTSVRGHQIAGPLAAKHLAARP